MRAYTRCLIIVFNILISRSFAINVYPYLDKCSPNVANQTMLAVIKTESGFFPWAININLKGKRLLRQPQTLEQAIKWADYLEEKKYNFDVGLAQVNIKNIHKLGYHARDLFDPCTNLMVASRILHQNYNLAKLTSSNSNQALLKALSAYNTGNYSAGFANGYVNKVIRNSQLVMNN